MANNPLTKLYEALQMYEIQDAEKQAEINKLKAENQELTERVRDLEEQLKDHSQGKRSKDDPIMQMYEAQAIAIEKEMEVARLNEEMDKMKEEMERLKREKEEMLQLVKQLGKDQRILVLGSTENKGKCLLVLSADRTKWIEMNLNLPDRSWHGGAVYLDDELYIIGGNPKTLYKLDKTLKWKRLNDMNIGRQYITNSCLEWNGYIWVFGGSKDRYEKLASVERYDPKTDKWTLMPEMKYPRSSAAAATWNNGIVICGGNIIGDGSTVKFFSPENGSWTELPNMPKALYGHSLVSYKNKLIVMGGLDFVVLDTVWQLDPSETNPKWRPLPSMKTPSSHFAGITFDEEIYAIGGAGGLLRRLDRVEIFDGAQWRNGPSLPYPVVLASAVIIPQQLADCLYTYNPE